MANQIHAPMQPEPGTALHKHHDGRLLGRKLDFHLAVGKLLAQWAKVLANAEAGSACGLENFSELGRGLQKNFGEIKKFI